MKKVYTSPEVVITSLANTDVITTSGVTTLYSDSQTSFTKTLKLNS